MSVFQSSTRFSKTSGGCEQIVIGWSRTFLRNYDDDDEDDDDDDDKNSNNINNNI